MPFVLTGFTQKDGFRIFAFEQVAADRSREPYTVKADLALIRRYDIRVQDLPLLCRGLLDRHDQAEDTRMFIFTEEDMGLHAKDCAAAKSAAVAKRKTPRRVPSENLGASWRGHIRSQIPPADAPAPPVPPVVSA